MSEREMRYRPLGRCGTKVSALSLGGWTTYGGSVTDEALVREILHAAFDAGINFFDIADVYARGAAEEVMGRVLADLPRRHLVISTKCFWPMSDDVNDRGLSRKHIMESVEQSLRRIGTDYLDILFCHRYDTETPLDETVRAMEDLVRQGKVLYWGTSEWTGEQLRAAHGLAERYGGYAPQVEQPQYSLMARRKVEEDVQPTTDALGMGLVVWSPLASGLLTGKYDAGIPDDSRLGRIEWLRPKLLTDENLDRVRSMQALAEEAGCSRTQLALAWAAAQPGISSVILGATSVAQLDENLGALDVELTADLAAKLDALFPRSASLD
ncbi:MAG: aldo/keto reductase family protein [Planctomycetota bacterium]|nr:aldo/keto reductase family protein [Planctomycetota bacterium]